MVDALYHGSFIFMDLMSPLMPEYGEWDSFFFYFILSCATVVAVVAAILCLIKGCWKMGNVLEFQTF